MVNFAVPALFGLPLIARGRGVGRRRLETGERGLDQLGGGAVLEGVGGVDPAGVITPFRVAAVADTPLAGVVIPDAHWGPQYPALPGYCPRPRTRC
jgi:hypothetical protein